MTNMRVLFDTTVVLDGLLERVPFVEDAVLLIDAVVRHEITGILCATILTTNDCIIGRERAVAGARNTIGQLLEVYEIAPVGRNVLESASASAFLDFEDAVLHAAVQTTSANTFVTRDTSGFSATTIPVYTPKELRTMLTV